MGRSPAHRVALDVKDRGGDDRFGSGGTLVICLDSSAVLTTFQRLAVHTTRLGCRTHIAFTCQLATDLFVSFDDRQRQLAELARLRVYQVDQ